MSMDFIPYATVLNPNDEEEIGQQKALKDFQAEEQGQTACLESSLPRFHPLPQTAFVSSLLASRSLPVLLPCLEHGTQDEDEQQHICKSSFQLLLKKWLIFRPWSFVID